MLLKNLVTFSFVLLAANVSWGEDVSQESPLESQVEEATEIAPEGNNNRFHKHESKIFASPGNDSSFTFIPQFGMSGFSLVGNSDNKMNLRYATTLGLLTDIGHRPLKLQTGLLYYQAGGKYTNTATEQTYEIGYLGIPLIAKKFIHVSEDKTFTYFKGGLMPAAAVSKQTKQVNKTVSRFSDAPSTRAMDVVALLGVGFHFPVKNETVWILDLTFNRGLLPVNASDAGSGNTYNQGAILTVGVELDI